ncbi:integrase catalytic domain-containing protein [Cerasicoccus arenae]|uniref:integrase catalytic domain-containing protein n=1 Tax=Cerasicoccus arenae TaxID=424488 RepID=UPI0035F03019
MSASKVADALDLAARTAGALPQAITVDNGPEFAGKVLDAWAYANEVQLDFIRPSSSAKSDSSRQF